MHSYGFLCIYSTFVGYLIYKGLFFTKFETFLPAFSPRVCLLWSLPPLLRSWPACESSSRGARVSFHQSGFFLSFSLVSVWVSFQIYPSLSSIFHSVVLTSDVVILWFRICFVPFPKLSFSPLSPVRSPCLSRFSYKLLSVFTIVAKIKLPFASSLSGPCKPLCRFSSLVCKPHVTFCIIWLFMMCWTWSVEGHWARRESHVLIAAIDLFVSEDVSSFLCLMDKVRKWRYFTKHHGDLEPHSSLIGTSCPSGSLVPPHLRWSTAENWPVNTLSHTTDPEGRIRPYWGPRSQAPGTEAKLRKVCFSVLASLPFSYFFFLPRKLGSDQDK